MIVLAFYMFYIPVLTDDYIVMNNWVYGCKGFNLLSSTCILARFSSE